jgi:hypothetical protein
MHGSVVCVQSVCTYVRAYVRTYVRMCIRVRIYACVCVCMYVCMCVLSVYLISIYAKLSMVMMRCAGRLASSCYLCMSVYISVCVCM